MIELSNLTKRYRDRAVVDGVSFAVTPGKVTGFLGPNGAGKSTTMRMILGLTRPDQGSATIGGRRYADIRYPVRMVGAALESTAPHPSLTVAGHLSWVAQSNRIGSGRIAEVLELMNLTSAANKRVGALSLGMGQRLALASALLGDPDVLILDEPTNGLDAEGIRWLRELLRRMAADGKVVFLSSHLMSEMSMVADHLLVIHQGRVIADTSVAHFVGEHARSYARVRTPMAAQLMWALAGSGGTSALAADGSMEISGMTTAEVRKLAEEKGIPLDEVSVGYGSLEDAYLSVISAAGANGKAGE